MKKLLLIFISLLFILGCNSSPEKQIEHSFLFQRGPMAHKKDLKIISIRIYDTITVDEVYARVDTLEKRVKQFEERIQRIDISRDSIRKLNIHDSLKRPQFQKRMDSRMEFDRRRDHFSRREYYNRMLDMQRNGNIAAYYAEIITNVDTLRFAVTPLKYYIICPVFMLE